jgi:deoxyribose-phosphate aldolase
MKPTDLIRYIDYTSLNFNDNELVVDQFIQNALNFEHKPAAICLYSSYAVKLVSRLSLSQIKYCVVACGFPTGKMSIEQKFTEIRELVSLGVQEIDIVLPYDAQLNQEFYLKEIIDIKKLMPKSVLKVIIESGSLTNDEINIACDICLAGGVDFIKTSTGKNGEGATEEAVLLIAKKLREHFQLTQKRVGIKVSGGIRTVEQAYSYVTIIKNVLGDEWLDPSLFRIGASSLITNIYTD